MTRVRPLPTFSLLLVLTGCSGSSGSADAPPPARLLVTTTTNALEPSTAAPPGLDPARAGASRFDRYYRLTTPANEPFAFELVSWAPPGADVAMITADHVRTGDREPPADGSCWWTAGMLVTAQGLTAAGTTASAYGTDLARLQFQGVITEPQLFTVYTEPTAGGSGAIVEIAIGARSEINRPPSTTPDVPSVVARDTVYSSPSWRFGLPAVAVSGDRTTVVCYEGQRGPGNGTLRYELRLQHDRATGAVTGGGTALASGDTGMWRDHEIVALYNVLGVVRAEADGVRVRLSFDRGATFAQDVIVMPGASLTRLVQASIAPDYSIAVAAWRPTADGLGSEFVLVDGRPMGVDPITLEPAWYAFGPPQVVHALPGEVTPLTTGIAWSEGGDLVVGYAASWFERDPQNPGWRTTAAFRCAVRPWGGALVDREVAREDVFGMDPSVAVAGSGAGLRIAYAYESTDGVALAVSEDAGATFVRAATVGRPGDHLPTVFLRPGATTPRIDVLYLAARERGIELHQATWLEGPTGPRTEVALTRATLGFDTTMHAPPTTLPTSAPWIVCTQIGWLGYDAVLDGDQIVAAYDEVTMATSIVYAYGAAGVPNASVASVPPVPFVNAPPPPLAPGLTEPMPAPEPAHAHQLKLLRLR